MAGLTSRWPLLLVSTLLLLSHAEGCRSKNDDERQPVFTAHQGTEQPSSATPSAPTSRKLDPDDPNREHEQGELKIGNKWEFPVATTKLGLMWGTIEESRNNKRILAFRGIPYVKPPVGPLRYNTPVPMDKWEGIKETKLNGHVCPQHMYYKPDVWVGKEDCLWLNVFTRDLVKKKKRPVIVYIHGGNFVRGSAADLQPDYIMDEEVVLVVIQYRLGMFGFLSTEDANAPGNYGLLDQLAALQWVKNNIDAFSGDPESITLMGHQAGAASVHYHMLSPLSRGLFHKAISMSGSALCWWASIKRPLEKARKLGKLLKCDYGEDTKKLVECFRSKSAEDLMNTHPNFYEWRHLEQRREPMTAWSPRVDPESRMPFLPKEPIDYMVSGEFQHVPWIAGLTNDEGGFRMSALLNDPQSLTELEADFETIGPLMFGLADGQSEAPKVNAKRIRDNYVREDLTLNSVEGKRGLTNAISDSSYAHPIDTSVKIHSMKSHAKVYMYHFGYRGEHSQVHLSSESFPPQISAALKSGNMFGAVNGDDLIYLFPILNGIFRPLNSEDLLFSQRLVQLLTTFVKDGEPHIVMGEGIDNFEWQPVNASNVYHLNLYNEMRMDQGLPNHERMDFWQQMPLYWNSNRDNYKPAPPIEYRDEL